MGTFDFGLYKILIYEMRNEKGKGGKYLEKEEKENCCGQDGRLNGSTEIEGSIRGPRLACTSSGKMKPSSIINRNGKIL